MGGGGIIKQSTNRRCHWVCDFQQTKQQINSNTKFGIHLKEILRGTKDKDKRKASRRVRLTKGTRASRRGTTWMISSETWRKPKELESLKPFQVSQSVPDSLVRSISKGPTDGPLGSLNVFLRYAGFSHTPRGGRQGCVICTPSYTLTSGPPGCWAPFISTWSRQNHQISPYFSSRMYQEQS